VLIAMLAHGSVNAAFTFAPTTALPAMVTFMAVAVLALIVVVATRGQLGYPPGTADRPTRARFTQNRPHASAAS
jgi:hypothetical protein